MNERRISRCPCGNYPNVNQTDMERRRVECGVCGNAGGFSPDEQEAVNDWNSIMENHGITWLGSTADPIPILTPELERIMRQQGWVVEDAL